ncbi:EAL domain-containing protein [Synechocystis salina]|uniref:EAL domain-containing protein n=1 Tax=Synechocystis salina LEGE 00031 TaxID=1828736 RepID=A0ABR9VWL3_9SYNC|nr:EAL domain-containing protein [Synechocystis salina]MBE9242738.1 EAL domain-containing protein [Synechocystis salina LEGE 00041]MBE9255729.1 EAL domain-containing protein [Synechocystis salina LEGE 00031]
MLKTKGKILVVGDSGNLQKLRGKLENKGYEFQVCRSDSAILKNVLAIKVDLILLYVKLGGYDAYELCRRLKADVEIAPIPIIFLSELTSTFNKVRGLELGGADYITQPFQMEELFARIATHISLRQLQRRLWATSTELIRAKNKQLLKEIEDHRQTQEALFFEKELAQVTLKSIGDAVITTDAECAVTYLNPTAESLTGWTNEEASGNHLFEIFKIINEFTRNPVKNPIIQALEEITTINLAKNTNLIRRDGSEIPIDDSAAPIQDRKGNVVGSVVIFRDVTIAHNLTRQLTWQASHDFLTGLINRSGFEQKLDETIAANNEGHNHVLCYLDLDQFKVVNDTSGHIAGDKLLRQVARLLQQRVREVDTLARLGGDEFAFLLYQCPLEKAIEIAETSRDMVEKLCFQWEGKIFHISISIGLVSITPHENDKNRLMSMADAACYAAKNKGRNCIQVYRDDDNDLRQQRRERQWVGEIRDALEANNFDLYCQTVIPINKKSKLIYYEVLLRLLDEKRIIVPGVFLPSAERYQLMPTIDRWVVSQFFSRYDHYYQQHSERMNVSQNYLYALNLSAASINHDYFLDFLKMQLAKVSFPLGTICFEITEETAISHFDQAVKFINEIKQFGCYFAIDDFGHGMNSFEYIKYFPVDYLKIDGSFVKNIIQSKVDREIVESFNRIGHVMDLQTIAEFVENAAILRAVEAIGFDYAQGYVISKPSPLTFEHGM